jgi:hypothetical protein
MLTNISRVDVGLSKLLAWPPPDVVGGHEKFQISSIASAMVPEVAWDRVAIPS